MFCDGREIVTHKITMCFVEMENITHKKFLFYDGMEITHKIILSSVGMENVTHKKNHLL